MSQFLNTLMRLSRLQRQPIDRLALQASIEEAQSQTQPQDQVKYIAEVLNLPKPIWLKVDGIDQTQTPALLHHHEFGWGILRAQNALGQWIVQRQDLNTNDWIEETPSDLSEYIIARMTLSRPLDIKTSEVFKVVLGAVMQEKSRLKEIILGGIFLHNCTQYNFKYL